MATNTRTEEAPSASDHAELFLHSEREQSNYFGGGEEKELDVAEFLGKSAPKQRQHIPFIEAYVWFAKRYGWALLAYCGLHIILFLADVTAYISGGTYHGTYQYFYTFITIILYFIPGAYSVYSCRNCTGEKIMLGYYVVIGTLLTQFFLSAIDMAYFAYYLNNYRRCPELVMSTIAYMFGYVNHYDFHKKFKKSKVRDNMGRSGAAQGEARNENVDYLYFYWHFSALRFLLSNISVLTQLLCVTYDAIAWLIYYIMTSIVLVPQLPEVFPPVERAYVFNLRDKSCGA